MAAEMAGSLDRYVLVAQVLLGAAHADDEIDGDEVATVTALLELATGRKLLPLEIGRAMRDFDPARFDLEGTVRALGLETDEDKRHLLELIAAVHDADEVWDLAEDAYLRRVAEALGLEETAYADLVVGDVVVASAGRALIPPPLPSQ
jgi:uncharacterized tellurite resistance protein B-like protein